MSLQHSEWNWSGFMHSATALVWQIPLPLHFHTFMPPGNSGVGIYKLCLPCHSSTEIARDGRKAKSLKLRYRRIYDCQSDKTINKLPFRKTNKWTKYHSATCLQTRAIYWNQPENDEIRDENRKKQWPFMHFMMILLILQMKWAEQPIIETKLSMHATFSSTHYVYQDMKT